MTAKKIGVLKDANMGSGRPVREKIDATKRPLKSSQSLHRPFEPLSAILVDSTLVCFGILVIPRVAIGRLLAWSAMLEDEVVGSGSGVGDAVDLLTGF